MSDQIDVNQIAGSLNYKMDLDVGNVPQSSKNTIVSWGMPDYSSAVSISDVSSITNTTNTNWFTATGDGFVVGTITRKNPGTTFIAVNGVDVAFDGIDYSASNSGFFIPVSKNDVLSYRVNTGTGSIVNCKFIPLKGVSNA